MHDLIDYVHAAGDIVRIASAFTGFLTTTGPRLLDAYRRHFRRPQRVLTSPTGRAPSADISMPPGPDRQR